MSEHNIRLFLTSANLLKTIAAEIQDNDEAARQLVSGLNEAQMNWKPAPNRWSVAECLDHLAVTQRSYKTCLTDAIARGRLRYPVAGAPAYKPTLFGGWLARSLMPDNPRKMAAPKAFRPSASSTIRGALDSFLAEQAQWSLFVEQSAGLDYNKTRIRSPAMALIRYSVADAYVIAVIHAWRHIAQGARVRSEMPPPNSM